MKISVTLLLKTIIWLIALGALFCLIWFPQLEGRATNLDLVSIYQDPLIIYSFIGSLPFFYALHQAHAFLCYIDNNAVFNLPAVKTARNIKNATFSLIGVIVGGLGFIVVGTTNEDVTGPLVLGMCTSFVLLIVASAVALFEKLLHKAVQMKSENELTV